MFRKANLLPARQESYLHSFSIPKGGRVAQEASLLLANGMGRKGENEKM